MIGKAAKTDIPKIVGMMSVFHKESNQPQKFDPDDAAGFIAGILENHVVLVSENGFICGIISPSPVNKEWIIAMELYWWAKDGMGVQLMKAFTDEAKALGASEVRFSHMHTTQRVGRFLESFGFNPDEHVYARCL